MPGLRLNKGMERYLSIPLLNILGTAAHWHAELVTNEALRCCRHRLDFETSQNEVYYKAHFALLPGTADAFTTDKLLLAGRARNETRVPLRPQQIRIE
jgi:hypothetical protein